MSNEEIIKEGHALVMATENAANVIQKELKGKSVPRPISDKVNSLRLKGGGLLSQLQLEEGDVLDLEAIQKYANGISQCANETENTLSRHDILSPTIQITLTTIKDNAKKLVDYTAKGLLGFFKSGRPLSPPHSPSDEIKTEKSSTLETNKGAKRKASTEAQLPTPPVSPSQNPSPSPIFN